MAEVLLWRVVNELRAAVDDDTRLSREALQEVVQGTVVEFRACVLIAEESGQVIAASEQALQTLGYTLPTLRALNVTELAGEDEEEEVELLWESFLRQRRQTGCFTLPHRDGTLIRTQYAAISNAVAGLSAAVHVVSTSAEPGQRRADKDA